jgi:hypothetical protein
MLGEAKADNSERTAEDLTRPKTQTKKKTRLRTISQSAARHFKPACAQELPLPSPFTESPQVQSYPV